MLSRSVVSDSLWPHGQSSTRRSCPWDFPGKNTGTGYHFLLQVIFPTQGFNPGLLASPALVVFTTVPPGKHHPAILESNGHYSNTHNKRESNLNVSAKSTNAKLTPTGLSYSKYAPPKSQELESLFSLLP